MGLIDGMRDALPEGYGAAILWVLFALLVLVAVLGVIRLIRGFPGGTFVAGGRNRRTRLSVMDATPVDARRRLVLVRRDDVEHLILIGGPTDVVVERDIRIGSRSHRPAEFHEEPAAPPAVPSAELERARAQVRPSAPVQRAEPPRPAEPTLPSRAAAPAASSQLPRPAMPMPAQPPAPAAPRSAPVTPPRAATPPRPLEFTKPATAAPTTSTRLPPAKSLDDALLNELAMSLEEPSVADKDKKPSTKRTDTSLDEQMNKLLGEISKKK